MATVSCPKCGREHEVLDGTTFVCACGERIVAPMGAEAIAAGEPPARPLPNEDVQRHPGPFLGRSIWIAAVIVAVLAWLGFGDRRQETPGLPNLPEEKIVAEWIVSTANDPKSVEFVKWGPNATIKELKDRKHFALFVVAPNIAKAEGVVRVAYREKNERGALEYIDKLVYYSINEKMLWNGPANQFGDLWFLKD